VLEKDDEGGFLAATSEKMEDLIRREIAILKTLTHPFVGCICDRGSECNNQVPTLVIASVENGSLVDNLSGAEKSDVSRPNCAI
jgi:hypothetical protein